MSDIEIWMPWYPGDYLRDTITLSLEEDAFYRRALDFLWQNPEGIPIETGRLCRALRVIPSEAEKLIWVLDKFLIKSDGRYFSARITKEREKAQKNRDSKKNNGLLGGRPPKEKPVGYPVGSGSLKLSETTSPSPSPSNPPSAGIPARALEEIQAIAKAAYDAYPETAKKDRRPTGKGVIAFGAITHAVTNAPDFPWVEYAGLISELVETPKNIATWAHAGPDMLGLEALRKIKAGKDQTQKDEWLPPHRRPI